jgi:hypothetical protein
MSTKPQSATPEAGDAGPRRTRSGAGLIRAWTVASIVYVLIAGGLSVGPIRRAFAQADRPVAAVAAPPPSSRGPIPDAPDSPGVMVAKAVGKQAALVFGPPLLALWFGWDAWFAIQGFLSKDTKSPGGGEPEEG